MAEQLRWGIIGTGGIARTFASDVRQYGKSGRVVAVGSRSPASADAFADEFDIAKRHSYDGLVQDDEVDAVYVATPHPMHHDNAMAALQAGKHVLVEKAFTMNAAEARSLVETARSRKLFLMEAMWTRFLPHVSEIRRYLDDGALGDITLVLADHGQWFAADPASRLFAPELGGGALLDLGVYPVSFASMVLGRPNRVEAIITPAFTGVDGTTSMLFGYESGAQAVLTCTALAQSEKRASIVGTLGRIEIDGSFYAPTTCRFVPRNGAVIEFGAPRSGKGLHFEADEVARCVEAGLLESPIMPLEESIAIMETMDEVLAKA